jgi:hypothetical protein
MIDGIFIVRIDRKIFRFELIPLTDIDWMHFVGHADFFQHDGSLFPVRRSPGIELDHLDSFR